MWKKLLILLAVALALGACSQTNASDAGKNKESLFALKDMNDKTVDLADYKGQKVYVKFWASWCPICLSGLDEVNRLAGEDTDFKVLTIVAPGYNNEKDKEAFQKWFKGVDNTENLPVLFDEGGKVVQKFKVRGYPTSAFINEQGELVKTRPGHLSNDEIKKEMAALN